MKTSGPKETKVLAFSSYYLYLRYAVSMGGSVENCRKPEVVATRQSMSLQLSAELKE